MEKRLILGDRILGIRFPDESAGKVYESFLEILEGLPEELEELMDEYSIPEELLINFREGKGDLLGFYYVNDDTVSKRVAIIDIFTKPLIKLTRKALHRNLLDTFAHEIIHHSVNSEKETKKLVREFMKKLGL